MKKTKENTDWQAERATQAEELESIWELSTPAPELLAIRERINELDWQIARLLRKRLDLTGQIGNIKRQTGYPVRDDIREKEVIRAATSGILRGKMRESIARVFRAIIDECRASQCTASEGTNGLPGEQASG